MKTVMSLVLILSILSFCQLAEAKPRVRTCEYDVHTVRTSSPRHDGYFQNEMELRKVAEGKYRGSVSLTGGFLLSVQSTVVGSQIQITAKISRGAFVLKSISGRDQFDVKLDRNRIYSLKKEYPITENSEAEEVQRLGVKCLLAHETFSDRLYDALED